MAVTNMTVGSASWDIIVLNASAKQKASEEGYKLSKPASSEIPHVTRPHIRFHSVLKQYNQPGTQSSNIEAYYVCFSFKPLVMYTIHVLLVKNYVSIVGHILNSNLHIIIEYSNIIIRNLSIL